MFGRGQFVGRTQVIGNERRLRDVVARKIVVVHREKDDVLEIDVAGLQNTHDLQSPPAVRPRRGCAAVCKWRRSSEVYTSVASSMSHSSSELRSLVTCSAMTARNSHPLSGVVALVGLARHGGDHAQQVIGQLAPLRRRRKDPFQQSVAAQPCGIDPRSGGRATISSCIAAGQRGVALRRHRDARGYPPRRHGRRSSSPPFVRRWACNSTRRSTKGVGKALTQGITHRDVDAADLGAAGRTAAAAAGFRRSAPRRSPCPRRASARRRLRGPPARGSVRGPRESPRAYLHCTAFDTRGHGDVTSFSSRMLSCDEFGPRAETARRSQRTNIPASCSGLSL